VTDQLRVTVVYTIDVENIADYEATTLEGAARNLQDWYAKGEISVSEDLDSMNGDTDFIRVEAVQ
jgi:hypothetical protein